MEWIEHFSNFAGTEAGERAINAFLAISAAIAAFLLWVFGVFAKLWKALFGSKSDEPKTPAPTYQIKDSAHGGFAEAAQSGIATGQVLGDQTINHGTPVGHITLTLDDFLGRLTVAREEAKAEQA